MATLFAISLPGFFGAVAAANALWAVVTGALVTAATIGFIRAMDARHAARTRVRAMTGDVADGTPRSPSRPMSVPSVRAEALSSLPLASQQRYLVLRQRCADMREIAERVSGRVRVVNDAADSGSTIVFDRFFDLFLKLLVSQHALDRFLKSMSGQTLELNLSGLRTQLDAARTAGDTRLSSALQDNIGDAEQRLAHYRQSERDAEFVAVELERLETKIETLAEMRINARDAEAIGREISAITNGAVDAETTMDRLKRLTDLVEPASSQPAMTLANDLEAIRAR
jgi:hypothetical protein